MQTIPMRAALLAALLVAAAWGIPAAAQPAQRLVLVVEPFPTGLEAGASFAGGTVVTAAQELSMVVLSTAEPAEASPGRHGIVWAEPDVAQPLLAGAWPAPNDPLWPEQYGPALVRAPAAWTVGLGARTASVCVVDTGVRYTHDSLAGAWAGGWNVLANNADPMDDNGHGTHVAGIAAATVNDGVGVAGMGNVRLYGVKALDRNGNGTASAVAVGIQWCVDHAGPRTVINLSLGMQGESYVMARAIQNAVAAGDLVVAAAGNDGGPISYPAALPNAVAVTCVTQTGAACSFSSRGPEAEIAAPGMEILSSYRGSDSQYAFLSGTSMSTPHVAGAAALAWMLQPALTASQLRARIDDSARDAGAPGRDPVYGFGLLDVACLVSDALCLAPVPTPPAPPEPCEAPGPDAFGYVCTGIAGNFTDISATGHKLGLGDDEVSLAVPVPFPVLSYGRSYRSVYVSSNGWLSFVPTRDAGCCVGQGLPSTTLPNAVVAGFWGDLDPGSGGTVHYDAMGAPPHRRFIVQFTDVPDAAGGLATFQIVLFEASDQVEVYLQHVPAGGFHATGIEDATGTRGLTYHAGSYAQTDLGVRFHRPASDLAVVAPALTTTLAGTAFDLPLRVENHGPEPSPGSILRVNLRAGWGLDAPDSPPGCTQQGAVVQCTIGTLAPGDAVDLPLRIVAGTAGRFAFAAQIIAPGPDANRANNRAIATIAAARPHADLALAMDSLAPTMAIPDIAAIQVQVTNGGPEPALATLLRVTVPVQFHPDASDLPAGCTIRATVVTCTWGTLAAGEARTLSLPVAAVRAGTGVVTAQTTTASLDGLPGNNTARQSVQVTPPPPAPSPT